MNDFGHYFRDISGLVKIDIYRFLKLFGVTDPTYQHAVKKIVCAGQRGAKDARKDIGEAIVSLNRALEMLDEDESAAMIRNAVESGGVTVELFEPASEIDDDSPKQQLVGQCGELGAEVYAVIYGKPCPCGLCVEPHTCVAKR
jgi:hypothetical protein